MTNDGRRSGCSSKQDINPFEQPKREGVLFVFVIVFMNDVMRFGKEKDFSSLSFFFFFSFFVRLLGKGWGEFVDFFFQKIFLLILYIFLIM